MRLAIAAFAVAVVPGVATAQIERYDLGLRLRSMERAWDDATPGAKRGAVAAINGIVPAFFAGQNAKAAEMLDRARAALRGVKPTSSDKWAESLVVRTDGRLFDATSAVNVRLVAGYDAKAPRPSAVGLKLALLDSAGRVVGSSDIACDKLPVTGSIPGTPGGWIDGDYTLRLQIRDEQRELASIEQAVSFAHDLRPRLDAVARAVDANPAGVATVESKTLASLSRTLTALAGRGIPETDLPAAMLLVEAEGLAKSVAAAERFYDTSKPGQHWLTVPVGAGGAAIRLYVPPAVKDGKPVPLVVALHGAGGSENMFFDSYGHGAILRECEKRGWMLVATRAVGLGAAPPVAGIVDELSRRYPVDAGSVFLVGHSMGAAHTLMLVQQSPERFAGAAALGGGASIRSPVALTRVPVFVGCGVEDFALGSARNLGSEVAEAGQPLSRMKEYADCEHVVVCQVAMADVFAFFEACRRRDPAQ